MNENRFTSRSLVFVFCILLFAFISTPSVKAQKIIKIKPEPVMVFRIGIGGHQLLGNGPTGGTLSFNCEAPVSKHVSWTANFDVMMNPIELALPPDTRGSYQVRFAIHPDFRYYTTATLRGFYIGSGLGIVAGQGRIYGILPNGRPKLNIFGEALTDLKIGWQGNLLERYVWNAFAASGFLIPLNGEKMTPIVRIGIQLGLKRFI